MFYGEKDISEITVCPYCKNKYRDPRILPCGRSICNECLESLINKKEDSLTCVICNVVHERPKGGFYKNKELAKLTEKKPNDIYRSKAAEDLKLTLKELKEKSDALSNEMNMGENKIKEYCDYIRNDIQLVSDSIHEYITNFTNEFMKAIDEYEDSCKSHYETEEKFKNNIKEIITDANQFSAKWIEYLNEFIIDDNMIETASHDIRRLIKCIDKEKLELKKRIFDGKLLKFDGNQKNIESSIIGVMRFENFHVSFDKQVSNLREISLKDKLFEYRAGYPIKIEALHDGKFIIAYYNINNNFNMVILDHNGNVVCKKTETFQSAFQIENTEELWETDTKLDFSLMKIFLAEQDSKIIVYNYYEDEYYRTTANLLKQFDEQLNLIKEVNLNCKIDSMVVYDGNVYCLSDEQSLLLHVYDKDFKNIENIGQNNENYPYFFPSFTSKFNMTDQFYLLLEGVEMKIMKRSDGLISRSFSIDANDFLLYLDKYILAYDSDTKTLRSYDFDGKKVTEDKFESFSTNYKLVCISDQDLVFFDETQPALYF